mgnify:CR=1 FL=1
MRIAVNTRFLLHNQLEGIGTFSHQVLCRLVRQHPEHEFIFIFDRPWHEEFIYADNVTPLSVFPQARHPVLFYWWFEWSLPRIFKKMQADVFFSPDGYLSLRANLPQYPVFHDLAFEHYPEDVPKLASLHYRHYFPRYAEKAQRVLTVSEFSKKDIVEQYGLSKDKIDVVYNGADELYQPLDKAEQAKVKEAYTHGKDFFLYVGALHQMKNITRRLRAYLTYLDACETRGEQAKLLVIVGRKAWGTSEMEEVYEANERLQNHVHFTGRLSLKDLAGVMASAFCHINVSYFEGFGIPILESMKCGVPVITSQNSPMEEVGGTAAITVDPFDIGSISDVLVQMHLEKGLRETMATNCQNEARRFSWQQTANSVWNALMKGS